MATVVILWRTMAASKPSKPAPASKASKPAPSTGKRVAKPADDPSTGIVSEPKFRDKRQDTRVKH